MRIKIFPRQSGLTLIEALIVVILFGLIASVAMPRFPSITKRTIEHTLEHNLNAIRNAIKLYAIQHNGRYPGQFRHTDGLKVTKAIEAKAAFKAQLLLYSDLEGKTSPIRTAAFPFGSYLSKGVPLNPLSPPSNEINIVLDNSHHILGTADSKGVGWKIAVRTGEIIANHPGYDNR
ncbi:MAG: type II secretion system protein [bacterium]|nr:type II secretion system protein [bacterium]